MSFSFKDHNPYIIAEIGVNHEGSLDNAKMLIDLVKEGGAHAAKFQSYKADTIASVNSPAYWSEDVNPVRSQHELLRNTIILRKTIIMNLLNIVLILGFTLLQPLLMMTL